MALAWRAGGRPEAAHVREREREKERERGMASRDIGACLRVQGGGLGRGLTAKFER